MALGHSTAQDDGGWPEVGSRSRSSVTLPQSGARFRVDQCSAHLRVEDMNQSRTG